ncbi:MAG: 50S ribosomal protein L2, partial [Verrucomicrobiae bacterium]|nr:50S ribosomal protein L2 [Verrucomicrobiae bacterium]
MPLKKYNPVTPSSRYKLLPDFAEITKKTPEKSLLVTLKKSGGRNNNGRITCRHRGGGHKRKYRMIDFRRQRLDDTAKVVGIEYDPNRSARIALIEYGDGQKSYILAPRNLEVGAEVQAGEKAPIKPGNALPLSKIPTGTVIHNVEIVPGRGGQVARSAGQSCILNNREGDYALIKMPSGEIRKINVKCFATIGVVGNSDHMNVQSA